jgi:hypothetical protein
MSGPVPNGIWADAREKRLALTMPGICPGFRSDTMPDSLGVFGMDISGAWQNEDQVVTRGNEASWNPALSYLIAEPEPSSRWTRLQILPGHMACRFFQAEYAILAGDDGSTWTELARIDTSAMTGSTWGFVDVDLSTASSRYLRISCLTCPYPIDTHNSYHMTISGLRLFGRAF